MTSFKCDFAVFHADQTGNAEAIDVAAPALTNFSEAFHQSLGHILRADMWPYRHDGTAYIACDVKGRTMDAAVTIAITGRTVLPSNENIRSGEIYVEAVDVVDALCVIKSVLQALPMRRPAPSNRPLSVPK